MYKSNVVYKNPNWYCKEIKFRAVRENDKFEVGCTACGNKGVTYDRRGPSEDMINYILNRVCTC